MGWKTRFVSKAVKDWKCLEKMDVPKSHSNRIFWAQWRLPSNSTPNSRPKGTFYFLRGPPTFVWSLWKSKRKPLKWHAFWLSFFFFFFFFFLSFFSEGRWKRNGEFFGQNGGRHRILRKILGRNTFKIFSKIFFLLRQENFHFLKTFSLYLERADESWLWGFLKKMCWKSENFSMADFVNFMS